MIKKDQIKIAKMLLKNSFSAGALSEKKIRSNLASLKKFKIVDLSLILKTYKKLIEKQLSKDEILIESPTKLTLPKKTTDSLLRKLGAKRIRYSENPHLVLGARILHGDWVYDTTLDAKLESMKGRLV